MTTRVTSGVLLFSATRTRRTSCPSPWVWAAAAGDTFGKSRITRRGRSRDSVTPFGMSRPLPEIVTIVDPPCRAVRTRSIEVANGPSPGCSSAGSTAGAGTGAGVFAVRAVAVAVGRGAGAAAGGTGAAAGGAGATGVEAAADAGPLNSTRIVFRLLLTLYSAARA